MKTDNTFSRLFTSLDRQLYKMNRLKSSYSRGHTCRQELSVTLSTACVTAMLDSAKLPKPGRLLQSQGNRGVNCFVDITSQFLCCFAFYLKSCLHLYDDPT